MPVDAGWFQGHVSLEQGDGFIRPWRLPFDEIALYTEAWWIGWHLIQQAGESTGVRLRLMTDAPRLQVECLPLAERDRLFDMVVDNELCQTVTLKAGASCLDFVLARSSDTPIEIWLPHNAPCAVRAIHLPKGCSLTPAPDRRRLLVVHGSSITHSQGAHSPARTWPAVAGRLHDLNVINLGFSGQCHAHTLVARVLRDLPADLYLLKMGVNIHGSNSLNGITFMPNVAGLVRLIREKHPTAPIALVSPIRYAAGEDRQVENAVGMSIPKFREQIADTVGRLRRVTADPNVHYFDGLMLFGAAEAKDNQPDGCHPDADGCEILGRRVARFILPEICADLAVPEPRTTGPGFANPVFAEYLADPFCWRHDGVYYAVGTGREECGTNGLADRVVPMIKSTDLNHWQRVGRVLVPPKEEFGSCFWAPEVAFHGDKFYMYYHPCGNGKGYHIRVAVADRPEGPYLDTGRPLTDVTRNPFAIDAHPFRDDDGQWYLFYATDFLDFTATTFRGTALVVDRLRTMTELEGNPQVVMRAHWPWQRYQANQASHGVTADWYTLEGPTVRKRDGRYYCFYSGGCYQNDSYGVDWLEADRIGGPWREIGCERGPQLMRSVPGQVIGPGHHSIVTTPDGADHVVYHAWNAAMSDRLMCVDRLDWTANGPSIARFASTIAQSRKPARCL